jgi:hypothetical protein
MRLKRRTSVKSDRAAAPGRSGAQATGTLGSRRFQDTMGQNLIIWRFSYIKNIQMKDIPE